MYQLETGLSRHPEERPVRRDRRAELMGAVETALHILNGPEQHRGDIKRKHTYSPSDFVEGERKKNDEALSYRPPAATRDVIPECVCPRVDTHRAGQGNCI